MYVDNSQITATLFKKTLGTAVATATIPTGAARGSIQVFCFGKDMGHRGGKKMKYVSVCEMHLGCGTHNQPKPKSERVCVDNSQFVVPVGYKFRRVYQGDADTPVVICGRTVLIEHKDKASVVGLRLRLGAPTITDKEYRTTVAPARHSHHLSSSLLDMFNSLRSKKLKRFSHGAEWTGIKSKEVQEYFSLKDPSSTQHRSKVTSPCKKTQYAFKALSSNSQVGSCFVTHTHIHSKCTHTHSY